MKIEIGTPMYGGQCYGEYHKCVMLLTAELSNRGHMVSFNHLYNESLIQRARNNIAAKFFIAGNADVLLFIDSDITFDPIAMADMVEEDKDIIGAITPLKTINFEGVVKGALIQKSFDNISRLGGKYNFNATISDDIRQNILNNESFKVKRIGTGVMSIKRNVFEVLSKKVKKYIDDSPELRFKERYDFFPVTIEYDEDLGDNRMMSEDYNFCNLWVKEGGDIYAKAGIVTGHNGYYKYEGDIKQSIWLQEQNKNTNQ
jgi:hypothetical protein